MLQKSTGRSLHKKSRMPFQLPSFIVDNSFSTGHMQVNIYGSPEERYEIRSEWQAVDIQIHNTDIA